MKQKNNRYPGYETIYFSQHGEENIINKYLNKNPDIDKGIYVDIGANRPIHFSNTYYYYKKGWNGLLIEPCLNYVKELKKIRPKDISLPIAITDYNGKAEMCCSAIVGSLLGNKFKADPKLGKILYTAKCMTINTLIKKYPQFAKPDFLSLDIETNEEKALSKCDFTIFKPRIICIEFPGEGIDHRTLWEYYLTPFYDFKEVLVNNAFYLRKENK